MRQCGPPTGQHSLNRCVTSQVLSTARRCSRRARAPSPRSRRAGSGSAGAPPADGAVGLTGISGLPRLRALRVPRALEEARAGKIALCTIVAGVLLLVLWSTHAPTNLVPRSSELFARWEAGPLYGLIGGLKAGVTATNYAVSALILILLGAYGVALAALRTLSTRMIVVTIVAANVLLMLGPPFQLTDMGNYLGYARLGGLHGMNPYTHVIGQEMHDPIYHFATWNNLHSPYGELFTALSYPLAFLPIPVAYWVVKVVTVLLSLTLIGIVCWCAKRLGRDPRYAAVLVGLNPIYLDLRGRRVPQRLLHARAADGVDRVPAGGPRQVGGGDAGGRGRGQVQRGAAAAVPAGGGASHSAAGCRCSTDACSPGFRCS